jgi:lipopolysaccharide transport system ATP-binding protein
MKPILEIQNLSKKYRIQHLAGGYLSLRERMANAFRSDKSQTEDFWALNDVSFEVQAGESIGIIGRNGAGKSTLLKILSKITPPTSGKIISRGRIASLLEVGTGFHPELTGRENIFFNGSLLGMKRMEIAAKFDEIVDFSGVEKFLDTPLKHYSSGMQLRLAFAVAAFLEPEILIIDEVLAVGDAEFQKKCLGKMEDVQGQGRTILIVSHNLEVVSRLCRRGMLLNTGKLQIDGFISNVISDYEGLSNSNVLTLEDGMIKSIRIEQDREYLNLMVTFQSEQEIDFPNLGFLISDQFGHPISGANPLKAGLNLQDFIPTREGTAKVKIHSPKLSDGKYLLYVWFGDRKQNFFETKDPLVFYVNRMVTNFNRNNKTDGFVVPECDWSFNGRL